MATEPASTPLTTIVCVRYTHDVEEIKVDAATGGPNLDRAGLRINDFDENGIEAALRLRDAHGGRALAVSVVGDKPPENVLLRALAMGMDELHLVCDPALRDADAYATAAILAAWVRRQEAFELLICGDTSVDEYRGEVGPRLAEELGIPSLTHVTNLTFDGRVIRADRALESWLETVEVTPPTLVSVGSETNDPRMPTLRQIRQAVQRPVVEWQLEDLVPHDVYGSARDRIRTLETYAPPSERMRLVIDGETADETARSLLAHLEEAAVIRF
jgi:electron transfer flavoprotein beta subunit